MKSKNAKLCIHWFCLIEKMAQCRKAVSKVLKSKYILPWDATPLQLLIISPLKESWIYPLPVLKTNKI